MYSTAHLHLPTVLCKQGEVQMTLCLFDPRWSNFGLKQRRLRLPYRGRFLLANQLSIRRTSEERKDRS